MSSKRRRILCCLQNRLENDFVATAVALDVGGVGERTGRRRVGERTRALVDGLATRAANCQTARNGVQRSIERLAAVRPLPTHGHGAPTLKKGD